MLFAGFALGMQARQKEDHTTQRRCHCRYASCFAFSIPLCSGVGTVERVSQVNDGSIFVLQ